MSLVDLRNGIENTVNPLLYMAIGGAINWYVSNTIQISSAAITANSWVHIAVSRSSASTKMFINGTQAPSTYNDTNNYGQSSAFIGRGSVAATLHVNGYLSNVRLIKGTAVYTGNFSPPTAPLSTTGPASAASYSSTTNVNTTFLTPASLLLNMTNAVIYDAAAQNDIITVGEVQTSTTPTPKFGVTTSIKFDPATNLDYLNILPVPPSLTLGTSNFTIEGWIYFNTVAGAQTIFDQRPASTNGAYPVLYMNGATMIWYVNSAAQITSGSLSTLTWYYFAITRSASVTRMYIDGVQVVSTYSDTNNYLASRTLIGVSNDIASGLNGNLQEFRITRGVARTITLPTAPFPTR
jgi:hypothetical protein